jgi:uncharacterized membrane protein YbhN (UPF0104 family)
MGGWGVQEYVYLLLFSSINIGANQAVALSVLYKLSMILISLPGGVAFAFMSLGSKR